MFLAVDLPRDLFGLLSRSAGDGELVLSLLAVPDLVGAAEAHGDADFSGVGGDGVLRHIGCAATQRGRYFSSPRRPGRLLNTTHGAPGSAAFRPAGWPTGVGPRLI